MKLLKQGVRTTRLPLATALLMVSVPASAQYATTAIGVRASAKAADQDNHQSGAARGALWGGVIGLGVGVVGAVTGESCFNSGNGTGTHCGPLGSGEKVIVVGVSTVVGAGLGALVGAVIGRTQSDHPAPAFRAALRVTPSMAGLRVSI